MHATTQRSLFDYNRSLQSTTKNRARRRNRRRLQLERLQQRLLLAADCMIPVWSDTDLDGYVTPSDVRLIINDLNQGGAHRFDAFADPSTWKDPNYDGWVTPIDALVIINDLNEKGSRKWNLEDECSGPISVELVVKQLPEFDVAVAKDIRVEVFRMEALASNGDAFLPDLELNFIGPDADAANANEILVRTDADTLFGEEGVLFGGDGVIGTIDYTLGDAQPDQFGNFDFDLFGGGILLPAGVGVPLSFEMSVADTITEDGTAFSVDLGFVSAERLDDATPVEMTIHDEGTVPSTIYLYDSGLLNIEQSNTPTPDQYVLAGTSGQEIALRAELSAILGESTHTRSLVVDIEDVTAHGGQSVTHVNLSVPGSSWSAPVINQKAQFLFDYQELYVKEGTSTELLFSASTKTGAPSGDRFRLNLVGSSVIGVGNTSQNEVKTSFSDGIRGGIQTVVNARVSSVLPSNPDPAGTQVPVGWSTIGRVTFEMDNARNDAHVVLNALPFTVAHANVGVGGFTLFNLHDATKSVVEYDIVSQSETATQIVFRNIEDFIDADFIDADGEYLESLTFGLRAYILNPNVGLGEKSVLEVRLHDEDIVWSDQTFVDDILVDEKVYRGLALKETNWVLGTYVS